MMPRAPRGSGRRGRPRGASTRVPRGRGVGRLPRHQRQGDIPPPLEPEIEAESAHRVPHVNVPPRVERDVPPPPPPPQVDPQQWAAFVAWQQATGANQGVAPEAPVNQPIRGVDLYIKRAREVGLKEYNGAVDGAQADAWIRKADEVFDMMGLDEARRVECVRYLLGDRGSIWWKERLRGFGDVAPTWAMFKAEFYKFFYPPTYKEQKLQQFLGVEQGNRSVTEYVIEFEDLCQFAPDLVAQDHSKCTFFVNGLSGRLRRKVREGGHATYEAAKAAAYVIEAASRDEGRPDEAKKRRVEAQQPQGGQSGQQRGGPSSQFSRGRASFGRGRGLGGSFRPAHTQRSNPAPQSSASSVAGGRATSAPVGQPQKSIPPCATCGKMHRGECRFGTFTCYQCGEEGHKKANCPQLTQGAVVTTPAPPPSQRPSGPSSGQSQRGPYSRGAGPSSQTKGKGIVGSSSAPRLGQHRPPQARVYTMARPEAAASPEVVSGIISICGHYVHALIDPGSTHSFISRSCSVHLGRASSPLGDKLVVATPTGESLVADSVFNCCKIILAEREFEANLIPIDI